MIEINIPADDSRTVISRYLEILNIINTEPDKKLTDGEIRLLTEFILLPEKYSYQRFSRYAKPLVINNLKKYYDWDLRPINLNTKIYELVGKGYIWRDEDGVLYLKEFLISTSKKLIEFKKIGISFHHDS